MGDIRQGYQKPVFNVKKVTNQRECRNYTYKAVLKKKRKLDIPTKRTFHKKQVPTHIKQTLVNAHYCHVLLCLHVQMKEKNTRQ